MKKIFSFAFLFLITFGFAQIPTNYYISAVGTGYTLKTQLYNIINGHSDRGYAGLYITYANSDKDSFYENNGTLLDMYTENPTGPECEFTFGVGQDDGTLGIEECQRYNREHLIPQAVFSGQTPMYSDAHFVVPADKYINGQRGDLPFGKVNTASNTYTNGTKKGQNLNSGYSAGYSGVVFEPIDEFKGDIARCLLYFGTRYEIIVAGYSYPMFNGTSNQVFTPTFLNILLTWNQLDPVSQREIVRNNAIYARQNNRNPFIDDNTFVNRIWGLPLTTDSFEYTPNVAIFPNPTQNHAVTVQSNYTIDTAQLFTIEGQKVQEINNPITNNNTFQLENIATGFYFLKVSSGQQSITKKIIVN